MPYSEHEVLWDTIRMLQAELHGVKRRLEEMELQIIDLTDAEEDRKQKELRLLAGG